VPGVIVRNRLGEEIDRVEGVWHLTNAGLRHRHWPHADCPGCRSGDHRIFQPHQPYEFKDKVSLRRIGGANTWMRYP